MRSTHCESVCVCFTAGSANPSTCVCVCAPQAQEAAPGSGGCFARERLRNAGVCEPRKAKAVASSRLEDV